MRMIALIVGLITLASFITGCAVAPRAPHRPGLINHAVYVQLKNPADADELVADCDRELRIIPGIVSYSCGKRLDTGRPNVDATFDVGLVIGFNSPEEYQRYLDHPSHQAAIAKWKPRWQSIRICDVIDPTD